MEFVTSEMAVGFGVALVEVCWALHGNAKTHDRNATEKAKKGRRTVTLL
jgi:hypothetical protein